jgi:hypothetical protein
MLTNSDTIAHPFTDPIYSIVAFYSVTWYRKFELLGYEAAKTVAGSATIISAENALEHEVGSTKRYRLPHLDQDFTPGQVLAITPAFLVWESKKTNNPLPDSPFLQAAEQGWKLWQMWDEEKGMK